jgi:hypothetical protein
MTDVDPFIHFDPTPYLNAPQLPLQTLPALCAALSSRMPDEAPPYVEQAEAAMTETVEEAQEAMVVRLRETSQATLSFDLALDNGVDGVWVLFRTRAHSWEAYQRSGLDFLLDDEKLEVDFEAVRDKATRARALVEGLFGDGLDMLGRRFPEQVQLMATTLDLIEADELEDEISELCGEEVLPILRRCQVAYEAMVDRRASKEPASRTNLRKVRFKLQRRIVKYNSLVMTMLDEGDPVGSIARVEKALEPMITFRIPRRGSKSEEDEAEPEDPESEDDNQGESEDAAAEE